MNSKTRQTSHPRPSLGADCSGVTAIEFAIVGMLFFFLILSIIDIARYFSVKGVATKAAQNMLDMAETAPNFDTDLRALTATDPKYLSFKAARSAIMQQGMSMVYQVASSNTASGAMVHLAGFRPYDVLANGSKTFPWGANNVDVIILRPGDGAMDHSGTGEVEHPSKCSPATTSGCVSHSSNGQSMTTAADSMYSLLANNPIYARIDIDYRPISPWLRVFGTLPIRIELGGYRELPPDTSPGQISYPVTSSIVPSTLPSTSTTSIYVSTTSSTSTTSTSSTSRSTTSNSTTSSTSRSTTSNPTTSSTSRSTTSTSVPCDDTFCFPRCLQNDHGSCSCVTCGLGG